MAQSPRTSIAALEALLNSGEEIEILPDGRIIRKDPQPPADPDPRPLTFRSDLGGEY